MTKFDSVFNNTSTRKIQKANIRHNHNQIYIEIKI